MMEFVATEQAEELGVARCPVCEQSISGEASETACGKLACSSCAQKHREKSASSKNKCFVPGCTKTDCGVSAVSVVLRKVLDALEVRCKACQATMSRKDFAAHAGVDADVEAAIIAPGLCKEIERCCPHKSRGCDFSGKLTALQAHLKSECAKGYRLLDEEAARLCGGVDQIKLNTCGIRQMLSRGGGAGGAKLPPLMPSLMLKQLEDSDTFILARDYQRLCQGPSDGPAITVRGAADPGQLTTDTETAGEPDAERTAEGVGKGKFGVLSDLFARSVPSADEADMLQLQNDYDNILASRVVDTWNLKRKGDTARDSPTAIEKQGVKRRRVDVGSDLKSTKETYRKIFVPDLPAEKPPPRSPTPPRPTPAPSQPAQRRNTGGKGNGKRKFVGTTATATVGVETRVGIATKGRTRLTAVFGSRVRFTSLEQKHRRWRVCLPLRLRKSKPIFMFMVKMTKLFHATALLRQRIGIARIRKFLRESSSLICLLRKQK